MSVFPHYHTGSMLRLALVTALLAFPASVSAGGAREPGPEHDEDLASLLQLGVETFPDRKAAATRAVQVTSQSAAAATDPANTTLARHRHASSEAAPRGELPKLEMRAEGAEPRRTAAAPLANGSAAAWESLHAQSAASGLQLAARGQEPHIRLFRDIGGWIMFLIGLVFPILAYWAYTAIGWCVARSLGKAIEVAIETYDTAVLGVDVEIGKLLINPFDGHVVIDGVTIDNPKGYKSDYLINARAVEVDFDMQSLILSNFKHVVVQKVALKRVDVIYEKTWSSSNVHDVLAFLDGGQKEEPEETAEDTAKKKSKKKKKKGDLHMEMQEVRLEDVGMRMQGQMLHGHGVRLALSDIRFANFSKESGAAYIDDILIILLKSVMKTIATNIVGRRTAEWCC